MFPSIIRSQVTRSALSSLQSSYVHAAQSFQTYNFREYFLRLSARKFSTELDAILGAGVVKLPAVASTRSNPLESDEGAGRAPADGSEDLLAGLEPAKQEELKRWLDRAHKDLEQWMRASVVNNLFIAPKLVVEGAGTMMTDGGGGAGMEAR